MNKLMKRVVSLVLATVMVLTTCVVAFAADKEKAKQTPVIAVHGMMAATIYNYYGTEDQTEAMTDIDWGLDGADEAVAYVESLANLAANAVPMADVDYDKVIDGLACLAKRMRFDCDENGNQKYGAGVDTYDGPISENMDYFESPSLLQDHSTNQFATMKDVGEQIGYENLYQFWYDWRLDATDNAKELHDYIAMVKEQTGSDKVILEGESEAGIIFAAYLDMYKDYSDIERLVALDCAWQGVTATELYEKDITTSRSALYTFALGMADGIMSGNLTPVVQLVEWLLDIPLTSIIDNINDAAEQEEIVDRLYLEVLKPIIGNWGNMWDFIPYDHFDAATSTMADLGYLDTTSGLYKKICRYHKAQGNLAKNLKALKASGADVAIFATYGINAVPLTSGTTDHSDYLISTKYESVGATVADYGETLNATGKYVSPDRVIDASTCALPDNTWFLKDNVHCNVTADTELNSLLVDLTVGNVGCNLKSVQKKYGYSQFLIVDTSNDGLDLVNVTEDTPVDEWVADPETAYLEMTLTNPLTGEEFTFRVEAV